MKKFTEAYVKEHKKESEYLSYLLSEINAGDNTVKQSKIAETLKIDEDWIEVIAGHIFFVEQIVRKPTTFIKVEQEVVNIEKVRKVETDAVRHLAQNTSLIRKIEDDGMVQPKKLLNKHAEVEYAIYENRFVYTLLKRLNLFLNRRISDLEQRIGNFDITSMSMISKFDMGGSEVIYDMDVKFRDLPADNVLYLQNKTLMEKLYQAQARVRIMLNSDFGKILEKSRPVAPPIKKTNLLRLNRYYNSAFKLWLYVQSFNSVGYSVVHEEKTLPFDQEYFDDLTHVVMDSVYTILNNNKDRKVEFDKVETVRRKPKKFKVVRKVDLELRKMDAPEAELVDKINQYYYEQIKNLVADVITAKDEEADHDVQEQNAEVSARQFYSALMELNDEMFEDISESQKPEKLKNLPDEDASALIKKKHEREEQRYVCKNLKLLNTLKQNDIKEAAKKLAAEEKKLKQLDEQILKIQEAEKARKAKEAERVQKAKEAEALKAEQAKTKTKLEKEKAALKAEQAKEAAKVQKAKEAEKAKLASQKSKDIEKTKKAKEAEKAKAAAQRTRDAEKAKKAKEIEKEKAAAQALKTKEAEKAKKAKEAEKAKLALQKAKDIEKAKKAKEVEKAKAAAQALKVKEVEKAKKAKETEKAKLTGQKSKGAANTKAVLKDSNEAERKEKADKESPSDNKND